MNIFAGNMNSPSNENSQLSGIYPFISCDSITLNNAVSIDYKLQDFLLRAEIVNLDEYIHSLWHGV